MPVKSIFPSINVPDQDIWSYWLASPRSYPDDHPIFIEPETGRSYSLANLRELSTAFGRGLKHQLKWQKGDILGVFAANNIDVQPINFGALWAGGVVSPANPTYTVEELARQLKDSGAKALVTQKDFLPSATKAAEAVGLPLDRVFVLGSQRDETSKFRHWTDLTAKDAWIQPSKTPVEPSKDLAYLVYSSGTTGLPKGVMLTHTNIIANAEQTTRFDPRVLTHNLDAQLGILPWFHIYGLNVAVSTSLFSGARCIVMAKFDLERACQLIQEHAITFLYVPPPIVLGLGKAPIVDKYDLSSLRYINSGAAPLSKHLVEAVWNRLRIGVKQGYGLSETSPTTHIQQIDEFWKFQGAVGRLVPNMEAMLVDPEGKEVPRGQTGELLLKGPNVFGGYWQRPELNKDSFTEDGWYRTGDVGYVDEKDNFYITDRIKELIKYKGFQVPPAELEEILVSREDIADACVIGVWNEEQATEVPRAYVVLKAGAKETEETAKDIIDWLSTKVAPPKRLRGGVRFAKEIPKSASGKILRRVLVDQVRKEEAAPKAKL